MGGTAFDVRRKSNRITFNFLQYFKARGEHVRTLDFQNLTSPINQSYFWGSKNKYGNKCDSGATFFTWWNHSARR